MRWRWRGSKVCEKKKQRGWTNKSRSIQEKGDDIHVHGDALYGSRSVGVAGESECQVYRATNKMLYATVVGGNEISTQCTSLLYSP